MVTVGRQKGLLGVVLGLALAGAAHADELRELHYRVALYDLYRQAYFDALGKMAFYDQAGRLPERSAELALVEGSAELGAGMVPQAEAVYRELLTDRTQPSWARDVAWYGLAQTSMRAGDTAAAEQALLQVKGELPGEGLAAERHYLLAAAAADRGDYREAERRLRKLDKENAAFVRFNLAVALVKAGRKERGIELLEDLGGMRASTETLAALKDKASLTLGFLHLKEDRPKRAAKAFERVRLSGPFSNKALLGLGWSRYEEKRLREAAMLWDELRGRDHYDLAVQEAMLATPFVLSKLEARRKALVYYDEAIATYESLQVDLDVALDQAWGEQLLQRVLRADVTRPASAAPENRFYTWLLKDEAFRESLHGYRDLLMLEERLARWAEKMDLYAAASQRRGPQVRGSGLVNETRLADLEKRRAALIESFKRAARTAVRRPPATIDRVDRDLAEIKAALRRLRANGQNPNVGGGTNKDVEAMRARLTALRERLQSALETQKNKTTGLALAAVERRKRNVAAYLIQARYGVAKMYDTAQEGGLP